MAWWGRKSSRLALAKVARVAWRGASSMALVTFAALYFSALSLGSITWLAMVFAPWFLSSSTMRWAPWVSPGVAWCATAWALAWAIMGARSIHRLAKPRMRRTVPGGAWLAWGVVAWLAWLDAAFELGRSEPEGFESASKDSQGVGGGFALGRVVCRALWALPRRSMACGLGLLLILAMPLGLHIAMAMALPLVLIDLIMPEGPSIGLLGRVKRAALDMSKEGSEEWAHAERAQIDKEVDKSLQRQGARQREGPSTMNVEHDAKSKRPRL